MLIELKGINKTYDNGQFFRLSLQCHSILIHNKC